MFWPAAPANRRRGPAPSGRAASARESACSNLRSVFRGCPSLSSAFLFLLMVVQTFRMKIQEPPVSCDAGRVGGGDADCDKPSCEDVPRLDLTALTEENSWGGRPSGCCFHPGLHVSHTCRTIFFRIMFESGVKLFSTQLCTWVPGKLLHTFRTSFCLPYRI